MDTIIHDIMEKITLNYTNILQELVGESRDFSKFIIDLKKTLDDVGTELASKALEIVDDVVRESKNRKEKYYIQRRNDKKALITVFGEVNYKRTYYKHKKNKNYVYLSDQMVGIEPHDRMDLSYEAMLIEESTDSSYQKTGEKVAPNATVSKQTVMNAIRKLEEVENSSVKIATPKRETKILYIEADEDHVAMQDGTNKQIKLIYVHEGKELVSKNRCKLKNIRYFTGNYSKSEDLWLQVADYLEEAYEMDKVQKVYLSGDGASWIKEGLNWINDSVYVLDGFHLAKYIRKATAHLDPIYYRTMWKHIDNQDKKSVTDIFNTIIKETEKDTKKNAVKDSKRYILNNWDGVITRYETDYIGCSAEGHISHILSSRLSSRPLGWSLTGADQMARLRVFRANGGEVYELMNQKRKEDRKEKRILKLEKRILENRLKSSLPEIIDNIPYINDGRRTWQGQILKSLRGA